VGLPRRTIPSVGGLLAFEATARHLSFSRAAEDLCLSQGAVSKRVRQLEQIVGVQLLLRNRHHVHLTETGQTYLARVRQLLDELEATTRGLSRSSKDTVTIACPLSFSLRWLIPRLERYRRYHPDIHIELLTTEDGTAPRTKPDIECLVRKGAPRNDDALLFPLFDLQWVAVTNPRYRDRNQIQTISDLQRLTRIEQLDKPDLWQRWLFKAGGTTAHCARTHRVDALELAIATAAAGGGVALAPRELIEAELHSLNLTVAFETGCFQEDGYQLSVSAHLFEEPTVSSFVDWIRQESDRQYVSHDMPLQANEERSTKCNRPNASHSGGWRHLNLT
jgi:LysR family glycine cleavage system transcriptional activator